MSTKRTPINRPPRGGRITPEAVSLFKLACEIRDADLDEKWEDKGGRRREYHDASMRLHTLLGLPIWHEEVMTVRAFDECPKGTKPDEWLTARELLRQLEAASA
jgi:hypothetical protein